MNSTRLAVAVVAIGLCPLISLAQAPATSTAPVLAPAAAPAPASAPPFTMDKQYSANMAVAMKNGMTFLAKTYVADDKVRSDMALNGMDVSAIVRKDKGKIYQLINAQKIAMEMDFDPSKFDDRTAAAFGPEGIFQLIGPDTIDGTACTKYKVTSDKTKQVFFFWLDVAKKLPIQMAAVDGSFSVKWSNYKPGPQDPVLFEIPTGFQTMPMQGMPGMPGADGA